MRSFSSVAPPRSVLFAAVAATVLAMSGTVGAQVSSTGTISEPVGPGNTTITGTLEIGGFNSTGTITVSNGSLLETGTTIADPVFTDGLLVGTQSGSNGTLTIESGGDVTVNARTTVGTDSGTGLMTVDGLGSTFTNSSTNLTIGRSGNGTLNVQNSGQVTTGNFSIGNSSSGDGTVNLTGSGSIIDVTGAIFQNQIEVGRSGTGNLNISDGALLSSNVGAIVGNNSGSTGTVTIQSGGSYVGSSGFSIGSNDSVGTVTVDGSSSQLSSNSFFVGSNGTGTLNVQNGSDVTAVSYAIGVSSTGTGPLSSGSGTVNLTGAGSSIIATGGVGFRTLTIGDSGNDSTNNTGTLNITGGATFNSTGSTTLADETTDTGTINISGAGSTLTTTSFFSVGSGGSGHLNIGDNPSTGGVESGGVVNSVRAGVATQNTADPSVVNVNGTGAQWNLLGTDTTDRGAMLQLAGRGNGTINVSNGGKIVIDAQGTPTGSSQGGLQIGGFDENPQADGTLNIDGTGSSVTTSTGYVQIGRLGTGIVNVTNSASLDTSGAVTNVVGRKVGAIGTVNVTGAGSSWNAGANIFVGTEVDLAASTATGPGGNGTLNVANGGAVFAQDIINGASGRITGGGGTITGNIQNDGTIAAGNSPGLMSIVGNLDHNAGATIEVEIGGTTFNTGISQFDYDRIDVSDDPATTGTTEGIATIDLAAIFSVEFIDGFSAASGDSFDILIADTISGLITQTHFSLLPTLTAGLSWDFGVFDVSGRDALRLFVTGTAEAPVPEPGALLILIGGLGVLALFRRRQAIARA